MKLVLTDSRKVSQFSSILKNLKNFSGDIEIHINQDKLYAQGMDSSHCCLFELELLKSWFTEYENTDIIRLGINCELLSKIFNMLGENQTIELDYKRGADNLYVTLSPKDEESGIVRKFKLPLITIQIKVLICFNLMYLHYMEEHSMTASGQSSGPAFRAISTLSGKKGSLSSVFAEDGKVLEGAQALQRFAVYFKELLDVSPPSTLIYMSGLTPLIVDPPISSPPQRFLKFRWRWAA